MRKLISIAAAAAALTVVGAANAANTTGTSLSYEFDNGTSWTLQQNTAALKTTYGIPDPAYSDAGIVVDLGPLANLDGIGVTGSNVEDNIWISDGPSEANMPGTHPLADPVDFAYGFDNGDGTFWMTTDGSNGTGNKSLDDLKAEHPDAEAYAWVGVVYRGQSVSGSVSAVNGRSVGNRTISFTNGDGGTVTVALH